MKNMKKKSIALSSAFIAALSVAAIAESTSYRGGDAEWVLHNGKNWQRITGQAAVTRSPEEADRQLRRAGNDCPVGMVKVQGQMVQNGPVVINGRRVTGMTVEALQRDKFCTSWIQREYPERCAKFDEAGWRAVVAQLPRKEMSFCMDRYEYPNVQGANPWIMVTWHEAHQLCEAQGKRMCNEEEWTFACEGEEALPYPYGFERSDENCNIDKQWRPFSAARLGHRWGHNANRETLAAGELEKLWQGQPSGSRPGCVSPFGVYDMTGSVDEWTSSVSRGGHPSILKGGYWGPVRTRCRPSTRSHDEIHTFYQQGVRCCAR